MAFRGSLDLTDAAPVSIVATWYCRHPFHGIQLPLGGTSGEAETCCAACSLPRQEPDGSED